MAKRTSFFCALLFLGFFFQSIDSHAAQLINTTEKPLRTENFRYSEAQAKSELSLLSTKEVYQVFPDGVRFEGMPPINVSEPARTEEELRQRDKIINDLALAKSYEEFKRLEEMSRRFPEIHTAVVDMWDFFYWIKAKDVKDIETLEKMLKECPPMSSRASDYIRNKIREIKGAKGEPEGIRLNVSSAIHPPLLLTVSELQKELDLHNEILLRLAKAKTYEEFRDLEKLSRPFDDLHQVVVIIWDVEYTIKAEKTKDIKILQKLLLETYPSGKAYNFIKNKIEELRKKPKE